jgi:hypothetical protein
LLDDALRILRTATGREREHAYARIVEAVTPYLRKLAKGSPDNLQDLLLELFLSIEAAEEGTLPNILRDACEFYAEQKRPTYACMASIDASCFRDLDEGTFAQFVSDAHRYAHLRAPYEDEPPATDEPPVKTRFHVPRPRDIEEQRKEIEHRLAWVEERNALEAVAAAAKLERWERLGIRRAYRTGRIESGLRGASHYATRNRWRADFCYHGTQYFLGHYLTSDAATAAVAEAEAHPVETIERLKESKAKRKPGGVLYDTRVKKWKANGCRHQRKIHLGFFDTEEKARAARRAWEESAAHTAK